MIYPEHWFLGDTEYFGVAKRLREMNLDLVPELPVRVTSMSQMFKIFFCIR